VVVLVNRLCFLHTQADTTRFDDPEAEPYTLRIVSVKEGVLRIRRWSITGATLSGTREEAGV
jgi:hypothetical protein